MICPKCGPYSEIRYCSKAHLLEDVKWHWAYCGMMNFEYPCKESSIPREIRVNMPCLIPCVHGYDTPERHRQAVYFNVCGAQGDYFIFSDWGDLMEAGGGLMGWWRGARRGLFVRLCLRIQLRKIGFVVFSRLVFSVIS